jgi:S1-C subfamily serine protease
VVDHLDGAGLSPPDGLLLSFMATPWSKSAHDLVENFSSAVFYVEVKTPSKINEKGETIAGDVGIGTAFNLGDGYFATARHVIEGNKVLKIGRNDTSMKAHVAENGVSYVTRFPAFETNKVVNIFNHPSDEVDVSIIQVEQTDTLPVIQIDPGTDAKTEGDWLMDEVVTMGYPPIPFASAAHLVVFRGEVSAVIKNRVDKHRHFILSGMARGGFSGGPVMTVETPTRAIGIVCNSLADQKQFVIKPPIYGKKVDGDERDGDAELQVGVLLEELGFIGAISVEALFELAEHHKLRIKAMLSSARGFIARETPGEWRKV